MNESRFDVKFYTNRILPEPEPEPEPEGEPEPEPEAEPEPEPEVEPESEPEILQFGANYHDLYKKNITDFMYTSGMIKILDD